MTDGYFTEHSKSEAMDIRRVSSNFESPILSRAPAIDLTELETADKYSLAETDTLARASIYAESGTQEGRQPKLRKRVSRYMRSVDASVAAYSGD